MKKKEEEEIKGRTTKKNIISNKDLKVKAFLNDIKNNTYNNLKEIDNGFGKLTKKDQNLVNPPILTDNLSQMSKSLSTINNEISNKQDTKNDNNSSKIPNNNNKNNKSYLINNSNLLNLEEIPETSNANINLMNLQNLINKEEDTLSPIIRNKNISEFLSNNKLINTDLKSSKKSREVNINNEDPKSYENPFGTPNENNLYSIIENKSNNGNNNNKANKEIQENLETPKTKKGTKKTTQEQDLKASSNKTKAFENKTNQYKLNDNNKNYKTKSNDKMNIVNTDKNIIYSSINNQEPGTTEKINRLPYDIDATVQRIRESESEHEKDEEHEASQGLILNSERIKQQEGARKAEKVVFTLSKINEPLNNNFAQSRAFEFFDSNELESTKAKIPFQSDNYTNNENDEVKRNFNFNNLDFVPIENENEIENSKRFGSKTLTNFHNSNEYFADNYNSENNNFNLNNGNKNHFNYNSNDNNYNNLSNNENMIVLKTESDDLNRSNDLKEKINELNMSINLRKSGSLNFTRENRKNFGKGKLLRRSNTNYAYSNNSNKNSSKNLVSLSATNKIILNNYLSNKISGGLNKNPNLNNSNSNINNNLNNSKTLNFSKSINFSKINNSNNLVNTNKYADTIYNNNNNNQMLNNNFINTNPVTQNNTNFLTTNVQDLTNDNQIFSVNYNNNNINQSKRNSANNLPDLQRSALKPTRSSLTQASRANQVFPTSSYTYHNSSYLKDAEQNDSLIKSKYENSKIFETAEIMALISNAKSLEKVLSDDTPLTRIEEFEKKLQANAKLIESLQGNSAELLHDKMEMEIKIKEVKGLINQFNDRFVKIDNFLDKGKLKNFNSEFNRTVFDESEYMPNSKSFLFSDSNGKKTVAQPFSSFKKKAELSTINAASGEKLNRTFHPKNTNFNISSGKKKNDLNNGKNLENEKRKGRKADKVIEKEKIEFNDKAFMEESSPEKQLIKAGLNSKSASKDIIGRNKNLEIKNVSRINPSNKNKLEEESILKQEKVVEDSNYDERKKLHPEKIRNLSSGGSDLGLNADHHLNSYKTKKLMFSKEDEEELENLEKEIKKIDFDLKINKEINENNNNNLVENKNKENQTAKKDQIALKANQEEKLNSLNSSQKQNKNYKKIEINKLLSKKNPSREKNKTSEKGKIDDKKDKEVDYPNNERTMRSNMRSTKYDSDFNNNNNNNFNSDNNKGNLNITNESRNYNNMSKIQKILYDLETIKNRTLNLNNSNTKYNTIDNNDKENNINKQKINKAFDTNVSNNCKSDKINKSKFSNYNSKYNSGNELSSGPEENADEEDDDFNSHNKTYYKSNKTFIDSDNSKLINKFFKEEKIAEAIEIWKRLDYGRFEGMSLDRSYEMMAQITKIKDKDIEKLKRKLSFFNQMQAESSKKDSEIIELVGEVESLKYKILEMESQIGNHKNLENKMDEIKKDNSFLFKENVKLRALLDQERYFNSYRNQPNFMKK